VRSIGGAWDSKLIKDAVQGVRVSFVHPADPASPAIELIEPSGPCSHLEPFLARGGGLHHLCFEVPDLEEALSAVRDQNKLVKPPCPAVAFGGRRIAWVCTRFGLLLEYLETKSADQEAGNPV